MTTDTNRTEPMKGLAEWLRWKARNDHGGTEFENELHAWAAEVEASRLPQAGAAPSDAVFLIYFDDRDRSPEIIVGEAGARHRFKVISGAWNAHLFGKIESNSRDDRYYSKNIALASPAPSDAARLPTAPAGAREALAELLAVDELKRAHARAQHEFATCEFADAVRGDAALAEASRLASEIARRQKPAWDAARAALAAAPLDRIAPDTDAKRLYEELLFSVGSKFPGESRHETALRYIRQAEARASEPSGAAMKERPQAMKSIHVHIAVNDAERASPASEQTSAGVAGTAPPGLGRLL